MTTLCPERIQPAVSTPDQQLLERLNQRPHVKSRIVALLDIVNNVGGSLQTADAAEQKVIDEVRQMGQAALQDWAEIQLEQAVADALSEASGYTRRGKKNLTLA